MKYTNRIIPTVMHANCGHGKHRILEDCERLNFISAGQGDEEGRRPDIFGRQIRNLIVGDILAVYRTTIGYVGIAQVISKPMDINNAILNGQKVTPEIFGPDTDMFDNRNNDYREWLVEIKWLTDVHLSEKKKSGACYGIFPTQLVTCSLKNQQYLQQELQKIFGLNFNVLLNNNFNIAEEDDETSFPEGRDFYRLHKSKERNKELIRLAKERYFKKDEKLSCQICNFSFVDAYGKIGNGFIEAHHIFPISELKEETITKVEDLALICSNCHRMLHRKRPWLTMDNIQAIRKLEK